MRLLTERLILRPLNEQDAKDIFEIRSNQKINQFIGRNPPKSIKEAQDFISLIQNNTQNNETFFFGITFSHLDIVIGTICLWNFSKDRKTAELGYELLPEYHNKGIMKEAAKAVLTFGFTDLGLDKMEAFTHKNNENSIKLLQRLHFRLNPNREDEEVPENLVFELQNESVKP